MRPLRETAERFDGGRCGAAAWPGCAWSGAGLRRGGSPGCRGEVLPRRPGLSNTRSDFEAPRVEPGVGFGHPFHFGVFCGSAAARSGAVRIIPGGRLNRSEDYRP